MVRTQVSLDEPQYRRARLAAKRQGVSLAEFVRRSLAEKLAREPAENPWMVFAGSLEGPEDGSQSFDKDIYSREAP